MKGCYGTNEYLLVRSKIVDIPTDSKNGDAGLPLGDSSINKVAVFCSESLTRKRKSSEKRDV